MKKIILLSPAIVFCIAVVFISFFGCNNKPVSPPPQKDTSAPLVPEKITAEKEEAERQRVSNSDIAVTGITVSKSSVKLDESFTIHLTIANRGTGHSGYINAEIRAVLINDPTRALDVYAGSYTIGPGLAAGESRDVEIKSKLGDNTTAKGLYRLVTQLKTQPDGKISNGPIPEVRVNAN